MSEGFQIALVDLREWLQKETAPIIKPLKDKGRSLLNEIKDRLDDVRENGDRIFVNSEKEAQKGSPKTYRCAKAANKMSKNILNMLDQIDVPEDVSYENFRVLLGDLAKTFAMIEHERRVWYPRISPYFILDRRRLDIAVKRAEVTIQELRSFLIQKYVKVKIAENTLTMIGRLSQLIEKGRSIQKQQTQKENSVRLLEEEMQATQRKIGLTRNKDELGELSMLEERISELREKVKYNLRHLQKPFYKMQSLARSGKVALPPDEARKLEQYMSSPFEALTSEEEGCPILKSILQKVDDAIQSGKLKLKAARLRKAREQIDDILKKDSLANLYHDCLEAASKRKQLLASERVAATQRELEQLQRALQNLQKKKESFSSRIKSLREEYQKTLERIEIQRNELEKAILKLTGKRVQVVLKADS
jgi:uncharacterized protein YlxW (UPF0749 family)